MSDHSWLSNTRILANYEFATHRFESSIQETSGRVLGFIRHPILRNPTVVKKSDGPEEGLTSRLILLEPQVLVGNCASQQRCDRKEFLQSGTLGFRRFP